MRNEAARTLTLSTQHGHVQGSIPVATNSELSLLTFYPNRPPALFDNMGTEISNLFASLAGITV
jgi:hypothetical protein